jgi:NADPH2:quinone reductase
VLSVFLSVVGRTTVRGEFRYSERIEQMTRPPPPAKRKREFALGLGADVAIDYTRSNWREELNDLNRKSRLRRHRSSRRRRNLPRGVSLDCLNGRHLVIGFAAGSIPALPFNLSLLKGATLLGIDLAEVPRREPEVYQCVLKSLFGC